MKLYELVIFGALSGGLAFGQAPVHGAASTAGGSKSAQPSSTDSGPSGSMQVKSIAQVLHDNPQLTDKMKPLLPAEITPEQACSGYKTLDQCLGAVHLAWDVKISFTDLKTATTGKHAAGLEKAVAQLAPAADAHVAVKKARAEAGDDMKGVSLFTN
jgi:hypothetical protein